MRKFLLGIIVLSAIPVMGQGTVSLDSCRRMAIANNKEILQQQIKIEQAGYQRKQAEAAYLPSFDFEGGYIYNQKKLSLVDKDQLLPTKSFNPATGSYDFNLVKDPTTGLPVIHEGSVIPSQVALLPKSALIYDVHNVFAASVTMTQPIYMGGKIRAMNNITHYAEELARNMHDTKVQDVVYGVDEAYWRVVSLVEDKALQKKIDIKKYVSKEVGMPTLTDIMAELDKPGLDPRGEVEKFEFDASIKTIEDLQEGMVVPGIVTNITKFGAFVDIGVHNDGLVHVSQMANRYISDPSEVVKLHEHVMVRVAEVDLKRKRIGLSMKNVK